MLPAWNLLRSRATPALSAGLVLCLGTSCATTRGKAARKPQGTTAAAPVELPAHPGAVNDTGAIAGRPSGRFVASARVNDSAAPDAPSPGQELIEHAVARAGEPQTKQGNGNGAPVASAERRVGVVRIIGAHRKFVLIETTTGYGGVPLGEGQELLCRGPAANGGAQTAVLGVSREREAPYLVADVVSGAPQMGDVAYFALPKRK